MQAPSVSTPGPPPAIAAEWPEQGRARSDSPIVGVSGNLDRPSKTRALLETNVC